jgi:hypothetical protein
MSLTSAEEKSLLLKQIEFKSLLKKAVYLIFMLMNMNVNKIHLVINVYYYSKIN